MENIESVDIQGNDNNCVSLNPQEKNMHKNKMDATPISDVMGSPDVMDVPQGQQIPNFTQLPPQVPQPQVEAHPKRSYGNLTDEQVEALFAGAIAVVAFSKPVQSKLAKSIPQFFGEGGEQSTTGLLATALVAAILYYFGKRFVLPQ